MLVEENKTNEAIIKTISFFDMFDFPLTSLEVWKYLSVSVDLLSLENNLTGLVEAGKIEKNNGFYYLFGREKIIIDRLQRYNYAERKFARVFWVSQIFRFIPWVEMVAVGNLIGVNNLRDGGDIDLFIVARAGRLWLVRFFTTALMTLFRLRPRPGAERDKICLSFYASDQALNFEELLLNHDDWYLVYWLAGLRPIFDRNHNYEKLISNNAWLKEKIPNWFPAGSATRHEVEQGDGKFYNKFVDIIFGSWEKTLKSWQMKHFPGEIKSLMNQDKRVIVNDNMIKLHTNDRRGVFQEKFNQLRITN